MNLTRYFFSVFFSIGCIFCHVGALHATEESDGPVETYLNKAQEVNNNPAFQAAADAVLTDATGVSGLGDVRTALANTSIENATKIYNTIKSKKTETHTTDSEESVEELEEKRTKEHNMLSGLSTAATGIGAMETAQAISEKKADEEAERDMKAYLETMRCNYQKGPEYKYSTEDILLPGGNELLAYYTEYKTLAEEVKAAKTALGMKPGIETEVVYDKAESGLYHYENIGKTGGAYTSLSNALLDANSEDAAAWDAEKDKTKKRLIAGATVAAAGVVAGAVGNKLIDKKYDKKIAEIEEKFSTTNEVQEIAEVEEVEEAKAQAEAEEQARKEAEEQAKKEAEEQTKENDDAQKAMAEQNQETITPIRLTPQPIQTLSVPSATDDIALNKKLDQDLKENKKALREYQRKSKRDMKNQTFPEDETKQETPIPSGPSPKLTDQNSLIKPVVTLPTEGIKLTAATAGINLDASVAQASNKQPENDTAPANLRMDAQKSTDMQLSVPSAQPKDKEVSKQVKKTLNDNKKNDQNKRNHKNKDTKPTETNQETPIPSGPSPKLTDQNSLVKPVATLPTEQTKPTAAKASVETDAKKTATAAPSDNSVAKGNTDTKTKNNTETKPATTKAPDSTADKSKTTQQKTTTNSGTGDTDNTPKKSASAEYINIQTCQKANPYDSIKCVIKETGMVGAVSLSPTATKKLSFTQDGRANWRDMASAWAELGTGATLTKTPTGMVAKYDASKGDTLKCSFNYRSESDWFRCTNTSVNQTTNNTNKKVSKDEKTCVDSGGTWELNKWGVKMECVCDRKKGMVSVPALNKCICYGDENKYDPKRHLCINTKTKKPVSN